MDAQERTGDVKSTLQSLRDNDEKPDFVLQAETGRKWHVHRAVLHLHSDVLYRMSSQKEYPECQDGRAIFKGISEDAVEAMIQYMYSSEHRAPWYDGEEENHDAVKQHIRMLVEMHQLADTYNIRGMKSLAEKGFSALFIWTNSYLNIQDAAEMLTMLNGPDAFWNNVRELLRIMLSGTHPFAPADMMRLLKKYPDLAMGVLQDLAEHTYREDYFGLQDD